MMENKPMKDCKLNVNQSLLQGQLLWAATHTRRSLFSSPSLWESPSTCELPTCLCAFTQRFSSGKQCHMDRTGKHNLYFFIHHEELLQIAEINRSQGSTCEEKQQHQDWVNQSRWLNLTAVRRASLDSTVTLYTDVSGTRDDSMSQFSSLNWQKNNGTKNHYGNDKLGHLLWLHMLSAC